MTLLIQWFASVFAGFKAKNPAVAAIILLVLSAAVHTVHEGSLLGVFPVDGLFKTILEYVTIFLTAVTGSHTFQYLNPKSGKVAKG
jgi:amino acid permease